MTTRQKIELDRHITNADEFETIAMPQWDVVTSKGEVVGIVYGASEMDALTSVSDSPEFDKYHALSVREKGKIDQ